MASSKAQLTLNTRSHPERSKAVKVCQDWLNTQYRTRPQDAQAIYDELCQRLVAIDTRYPMSTRPMPAVYIAADALHMMEHSERTLNRMRIVSRQGSGEEDDDDDASLDDDGSSLDYDEESSEGGMDGGGLVSPTASLTEDDEAEYSESETEVEDEDDDSEKLQRKLATRRKLF